MKSLLAAIYSLLVITCGSDPVVEEQQLVSRQATIRVNPISRGVYEYTLTDTKSNTVYLPTNLPDSTKRQAFYYSVQYGQKPMPVLYSGIPQATKSDLFTIGANDVPQPIGKAQDIKLTAIRREQ